LLCVNMKCYNNLVQIKLLEMIKAIIQVFIIIFTLTIAYYSVFIEPNSLTITRYKLKDKQIKKLKIVFVGDYHIKPNQEKRLKKVVQQINNQKPDIVLSTGDFVSGHKSKSTMPIEDIVEGLKNIKSKYGFFTVLGNHDWHVNGEKISKILEENGIKVLANNNTAIIINGQKLYIAGVEDLQTRTPKIPEAISNAKSPVILLSHSPDIFPQVPGEVNLTLAGHVHGGQVRLPFIGATIIPSKYGNKYAQGLIKENNKKMIVTRGIGNSILNIRFNCIPEIVVIEFE